MWLRSSNAASRYVAGVICAGAATVAVLATLGLEPVPRAQVPMLLVFVAFVVFGELLPITIPRGDDREEVTTSTTFAFAVLLCCGVTTAVFTQVGACLLADTISRRAWWKVAFNAAQFALAMAASGLVLQALSDVPRAQGPAFQAVDLPAIITSGVVFFAVNNVVTGVALALSLHQSIWDYLRHDIGFQVATTGMMLALSPIVVDAAESNLWLIPLLALPLGAIYRGGQKAVAAEHQASHDSLTDLPNRSLFRDRIQSAIEERVEQPVAVMLMDLDRFKEINDTLGHRNGDLILQQIGPRLRAVLRESDTVARLGGDEFGVVLPRVEGFASGAAAAEKVRDAFHEPFSVGGLTLTVEPSIGIAFYPEHGDDVETLLRRADVAMYVAKERHSGFQFYAPDQDRYSARRLALVGELRRALEEEEIVVHYQPKADLSTGVIGGVEALVRWQHPAHGLMRPDDFVPVAERTGLIRPLALHVLDAALRQCSAWQEAGIALGVAVNLSVRNLLDRQLPDDIVRLLRRWEVPPGRLQLEITESVIMTDASQSLHVLATLSDIGVHLSVDDFGTGHSSLAYLKRLPVDELKIDKSFVTNMASNENDAVIVRSTIDLGRNLGLQVVAEGVESVSVWRQLGALGCDIAQGNLLSRPVTGVELTRWLRASSEGPRHPTIVLPR